MNRAASRPARQAGQALLVRQAGQALLVALGLLLAGGAGLYLMFSAGQVVIAKQRLVNAADAAAWSAASWRARVLNYHAYSNRAIIANEVAIAQAVTLVAWADYFESLVRNAAAVGSYFPVARAALEGASEAAALAAEATRMAATLEVAARGAASVGYKDILQASQEILHLTTHGFGLNAVATEVARANDPDYFAFLLPDAGDYLRFTRRHESDQDRQRLADLVVASLDPFVGGPRSNDILTPVPSPCIDLMRLRKRGATTLMPGLHRWEAVDTMSFHLRTFSLSRGCRERELLPLAWGAAEAAEPPQLGLVVSEGGGTWINPDASARAESAIATIEPYAGIASFRELDHDTLGAAKFPSSRLAVVIRSRAAEVGTAANRGLAAGRLLPGDRFAGDGGTPYLWAMSAAEVYFSRPPEAPSRLEYASLFSPYWQVRLAAPTEAQRLAAHVYAR